MCTRALTMQQMADTHGTGALRGYRCLDGRAQQEAMLYSMAASGCMYVHKARADGGRLNLQKNTRRFPGFTL